MSWYCVMRINNDRVMYCGQDGKLAVEAARPLGMHLVEADTVGNAERVAAMEVARIRRGQRIAETKITPSKVMGFHKLIRGH